MAEDEKWRPIPGFSERYMVSSRGRVARILKGAVNVSTGYRHVILSEKYQYAALHVHKLVMDVFLGPCPDGLWRHHKDDDKTNNDAGNLEYITPKENTRRAFAAGLIGVRENHHSAKLTWDQVRAIRANMNVSNTELAATYGVTAATIRDIKKYKIWKELPDAK